MEQKNAHKNVYLEGVLFLRQTVQKYIFMQRKYQKYRITNELIFKFLS